MFSKFDPHVDDTTLRDGAQMPGIRAATIEERVAIAHALEELGVERLEMFGTWYDVDRKAAQAVLDSVSKIRVAVWVRPVISDLDDALGRDGLREVGISQPVSDLHLQKKLAITRAEALDRIGKAVEYAIDHGLRVFVHGEDSTRADWEFERQVIASVQERGAECYRVCDTVGVGMGTHSTSTETFVKSVPDKIKAISEQFKLDVEYHGHDDLGNAVTNTMIALSNGARWASTTILGMGERAGNAETEKVIMNLKFHHGVEKYDVGKLQSTCELVARAFQLRIPPNKAIVGPNVFTHQSGIHSDGVIKHPQTYEPFPPEFVGNQRRLLVGPYSGKSIVLFKVREKVPEIDVEDPRVQALVRYVTEMFSTGIRRNCFTEEEFDALLRMFLIQ
ncbi:MAG: isopropylmalate synthase [Promethearchaeota archaeon]